MLHNTEQEQSYIGCILLDNNIYEELNDRVFYDLENRAVFKAIQSIIEKWDVADVVSVWGMLGDKTRLLQILDIPFTVNNSESYLKTLLSLFNAREVYIQLENTKNAVAGGEIGAEDAVSEIANMKIQDSSYSDYSIWRVIADKLKMWVKPSYSTSLPTLDNAISAWWLPLGKVLRIVAYSNTGKSRLSYQITNRLLQQGLKVAYVSLEIDAQDTLCNLLSNYHKVPYQDVSDNFAKYANDPYNGKLSIITKKFQLSKIFRAIKQMKPQAVVLDYLQMCSITWCKSIFEFTEEYSKLVQQFAIENDIIWIDLSQTSQDWFHFKEWDRAPAKGSGSLQASCDVMLMMHTKDKQLKITVAKNRMWRKDFTIDIQPDFARSIMLDCGEWLTEVDDTSEIPKKYIPKPWSQMDGKFVPYDMDIVF